MTTTSLPTPDSNDLLIALNGAGRLTRGALCRLASDLDSWVDTPGREIGRRAAELGVPALQLERALALRVDAARRADEERLRAESSQARLLTRLDPAYPPRLADHPLPPPVLAVRGVFFDLPGAVDAPSVAMVGSRKMDSYGRAAARLFARGLARAGVTVVSGFARGVDQTAHRAAVDARGLTIAVLGCGVDIDYPRGSRALAESIAACGALVSEFPLGSEPRAWHFPIRNRVIAALAAATLVVQAKPRSGSLITAHQALELGRDVFAVPGRIVDELSLGTNELLLDGALPALAVDDLLDQLTADWQYELFPSPPPSPTDSSPSPVAPTPKLPGFPGTVLDHLPPGRPRTAEELAIELDQPVDRVLGALLELELAGAIERRPGPVYVR